MQPAAAILAVVLILALTTGNTAVRPATAAAPDSPPAGVLDPAFDGDGKVTNGIVTPYGETAYAVAIQPDGKIVAAGQGSNGSNDDFALTRHNSDGSLDATFDADGKVLTAIGSSHDYAYAVAIQSDGKIVAAGPVFNGSNYDFALARYNSNGSLDTSFDGDGKVTTAIGSSDDVAYAVAIQSDGKIVVAGSMWTGSNYDFALARYNSNGALDATFDADGKVLTAIGSSHDYAYAVTIQSDGKIVAAGNASNGSNDDFALARYNSNGTLDISFDGDGKVTTAFGSSSEAAYAVAVQSDGKIVAAGQYFNGANYDFALARYQSNGALDGAFGSGGRVGTPFGGYDDIARGVAVQSDDKIVVAGYSFNGSINTFALARYQSNGALDGAFGSGGKVTTPIGGSSHQAYGVAVQSDGKIVAAGNAWNGSNYDFALARYTSSGALDATFDADGKVVTAIGSSHDYAYAVAIQSDGKIVAAGNASNGSNDDFALARYTGSGALDATFSGDGVVNTAIGSGADVARGVAVQADGRIVAAGYTLTGSYYDFALARYNSDGSLDTTFDGDGKVTTAIGSFDDAALAVTVQADGKVVVAGYSSNGSNYDFALARYNSDGSLDTTFDGDGKVTTAIGTNHDAAYAVAVQADGKIVVAGYILTGSIYNFALARYTASGALDPGFGSGGKVTTPIGTSSYAYALAVQSDGKIVAAGTASLSGNFDFALARYMSTGALDTSFGSGGIVITPVSVGAFTDIANAVAVQHDGKIVAAGYASNGANNDLALVRYDHNGALDTSFDVDGKLLTAIGNSTDQAQAIKIQNDGKIVAAGYAFTGSDNDFALARYQVASTSSQTIADGGSAMLEGVTVTNNSGAACTLTATKYPAPPGGAPADSGELPVHWQLSTDCTSYNFDLTFSYNDTEVLFGNGVTESGLQAYRSTNGNDFALAGGALNTGANTVTVTGVTQLSWWALGSSTPLAVDVASFTAEADGDAIRLTWETVSEVDHLGFNVYRGPAPDGPWTQLNAGLIASPTPGATDGHAYEWLDADVYEGQVYWYRLEAVDVHGGTQDAGYIRAPAGAPVKAWLPLVQQ